MSREQGDADLPEHRWVLQVRGLAVRYGRAVQALEAVDLDVGDGAVVAVLGSNGAGKSTLLRAISGTLPMYTGRISAGEITLGRRRLDKLSPAEIVRAGIVQVPEGRQVFATMSVDDNLRAGALGLPRPRRTAARERVLELFPVLAERAKQRAGLLSGGEQQMLAIGRALMAEPSILLLDEPSLGLAPQMVARIGQIVARINTAGTSVVLVEQNAAMALQLAGSVVVLEVGRVALAGPAERFADSAEIAHVYLGGHADTGEGTPGNAGAPPAAPPRTLSKWVP